MPQSELLESFIEEATEVLGQLEVGVAEWQAQGLQATGATQEERMAQLSILAHRLRGSSALYGYVQLSTLASLMERLLDARPQLGGQDHLDFMALLTRINEVLRLGLTQLQAGGNDQDVGLSFAHSGGAELLQGLVARRPDAFQIRASRTHHLPREVEESEEEQGEAEQGPQTVAETLRDFVKENAEVWEYFAPEVGEHIENLRTQLARGEDADMNVMFRAAHTIKGSSYMVGLPPLGDFAHRMEDLMGGVREGAVGLTSEVQALIAQSIDTLEDMLSVAGGGADSGLGFQIERLSAQLRSTLTGEQSEPVSPKDALPETPAQPQATAATTIRVPAQRLEGLMEQVGELVTARARMTQLMNRLDELQESMAASQDRFQRTVRDFEERYLNPDMVRDESGKAAGNQMGLDVSQQFAELEFDTYNDLNILSRSITELSADFSEVRRRLSATVTDLAEENDQLGKLIRRLRLDMNQTSRVAFSQATARLRRWARERSDVFNLVTEGEDVMVESGILQRISDPLMHLLTNAVHHGIADKAGRVAAGKPEKGNVWIIASELGNFLEIAVVDDGQGLDYGRIREKALERGLRSAQELEQMGPDDFARLILLPGFTTAREVGNVAGRGVGLDVVATTIRQLGGELLIRSEPGVGTVFTLRLPTTQRIMDVLQVDLGDEHRAALAVSSLKALRDVPVSELRYEGEGVWATYEGAQVPVIDVRRFWGVTPQEGESEAHIAFVSSLSGVLGLWVGDFGQIEEVAVTAPTSLLGKLDYLSGMAVSGSSQVLPILEPTGLLRLSRVPQAWLGQGEHERGVATRRLLLVDDSLSVRRLVGKMLERGGYEVVTANDGQEAVDILQLDANFDGVITDLEMPRLNGYELLSAVRGRASTATLPILVMTTRAGDKHQRLAFQLGADDYFSKPVNEALLLRRLSSMLESERRRASA